MSRGKRKTPDAVTLGFESDCVIVSVDSVLPVRALGASVKSSRKYRQITASIKEVGLVEPPVVTRSTGQADTYMLLDGHIRIEVLKDLGIERVECLISTDDEAFTYNKRISRLAPIQEHKMIRKAIERGVSEEKIALALDLNPRSIVRKARLLDGICEEAVGILKDKHCAKKMKGITPEAMARMERELARLQEGISSIQDTYGEDHLQLTVIKGYLAKLLGNTRIVRYLMQHRPEFLAEFQAITEVASPPLPEAE